MIIARERPIRRLRHEHRVSDAVVGFRDRTERDRLGTCERREQQQEIKKTIHLGE